MLESLWILFANISILLLYANAILIALSVLALIVNFIVIRIKKVSMLNQYDAQIDKFMKYFLVLEFIVCLSLLTLSILTGKGIFANEHIIFK